MARQYPEGGTRRVLVESVSPEVDGGRHPVKRVAGDRVEVSCDLVSDGHDHLAGRVLFRRAADRTWHSAPLEPRGNDRWSASFVTTEIGRWEFTVEAWIDPYTTWRLGTEKKKAAGQDIHLELLVGTRLLLAASRRAEGESAALVARAAEAAEDRSLGVDARFEAAASDAVRRTMGAWPDLENATRHDRVHAIVVDPPLARFSAWYELFPRSCGERGRHGTLRDVVRRLDYVAGMGFDVLYLPPIHPIGRAFRKGPNNTLTAGPNDPGSPWAIGAAEGGHKSIHPELGTLEDFRRLVREARARKLELALDIAFQVSPDHPYVREHPGWFVHRPDGTIQYAENPPKKYQDVYPFDFECKDWQGLWAELLDVFLFWIGEGVRVFRVDNPHTKALRFWEWCIREIKKQHPDVLFLAEAFTRPKLMYALAKGGFSQSYTYFTWRSTKQEFENYLRELTRPPVSEFYRPNFWPNTPDILPEHLQYGGRATFVLRLILAATLSSNYGIYGPPFELMEHVAREGAEEYVDNEKFQLRSWDLDHAASLRDVIAHVNAIRRENPALQQTNDITFHRIEDESLLCFSKRAGDNVVLVVANLDPHHEHAAHVDLDLGALGVGADETFQVHDLLSGVRYPWRGARNRVVVDSKVFPAAIFAVRRKVRTERDFEYFL
ncbi:Alpha-amylase [Labilithrix luteola]|uniref:Alpha-1,4-glucan:maltose-1-phosphate maltosyltransferase n=1 Tax=Labilithrix luteola TaxID=1391654 RepID=A0A0K1Q4S6_9BACT|nr:alpha-1,4-glucan--maltose-1-phosphate maltosyltransferase [Labilithrix luteola]AKV00723.1 Alpha-amylase [Labilithrix luteola]